MAIYAIAIFRVAFCDVTILTSFTCEVMLERLGESVLAADDFVSGVFHTSFIAHGRPLVKACAPVGTPSQPTQSRAIRAVRLAWYATASSDQQIASPVKPVLRLRVPLIKAKICYSWTSETGHLLDGGLNRVACSVTHDVGVAFTHLDLLDFVEVNLQG